MPCLQSSIPLPCLFELVNEFLRLEVEQKKRDAEHIRTCWADEGLIASYLTSFGILGIFMPEAYSIDTYYERLGAYSDSRRYK